MTDPAFTPSPLVGEGGGEGAAARAWAAVPLSPTLPRQGGGSKSAARFNVFPFPNQPQGDSA